MSFAHSLSRSFCTAVPLLLLDGLQLPCSMGWAPTCSLLFSSGQQPVGWHCPDRRADFRPLFLRLHSVVGKPGRQGSMQTCFAWSFGAGLTAGSLDLKRVSVSCQRGGLSFPSTSTSWTEQFSVSPRLQACDSGTHPYVLNVSNAWCYTIVI